MIIETEERDVRHPKGKILLKNGTVLDCHPKPVRPDAIEKNTVELDKTGTSFSAKPRPKKDLFGRRKRPERPAWETLFLKEAFFLYEHRDAILSDSRMFLTPLPFGNNLAYTGTSGLRNATLGVYIEWWEECEKAVFRKDGEVQALTYAIAGSPLSGGNHCSAVDRKGETKTVQFGNFSPVWSSFMRVNQRYDEAKRLYEAYTLEETISKLREP